MQRAILSCRFWLLLLKAIIIDILFSIWEQEMTFWEFSIAHSCLSSLGDHRCCCSMSRWLLSLRWHCCYCVVLAVAAADAVVDHLSLKIQSLRKEELIYQQHLVLRARPGRTTDRQGQHPQAEKETKIFSWTASSLLSSIFLESKIGLAGLFPIYQM